MFCSMRPRSSAARRGWSSADAALMPGILVASTPGTRGLTRLALHVGELLGHLAVADLEQVDAANVSGSPVEAPPHDRAITGDDHLLTLEASLGRTGEERLPELADSDL